MEYRDKKDYAEFVPRQSWGADPLFPKGLPPLTSPVGNVVAVWTDTDPCSSLEECVAAVQAIQRKHVGEGLPDIRYNFLVGGDGRIYEGRGWRYQGPLYPATVQDHEDLNNNSIEIAFIDRPLKREEDPYSTAMIRFFNDAQAKIRLIPSFAIYIQVLHGEILFYRRMSNKTELEKEKESKEIT